jgi:hypothetical protein
MTCEDTELIHPISGAVMTSSADETMSYPRPYFVAVMLVASLTLFCFVSHDY